MKTRITFFSAIVLLTLIVGFIGLSGANAQSITAPTADNAILTEYDGYLPSDQDSVFVFCSESDNAGALLAPVSGCSYYQWYEYQSGNYVIMPGQTGNIISNLPSGGYRVVSVCGGDTNCSNAWVFVNKTIVDAYITSGGVNQGSTFVGCNNPFTIVSSADPVTDFTVHNPPSSDFIVSSTTQIEVCFSADHTYVSDLGFYLVAPGYGPSGIPSVPGQIGTVELLPSVAAWDGVTALNSSVLGCTNDWDIGTNCNSQNDLVDLCFTTTLPFGNPNLVACVCDYDAITPLTGTFASAGPWSMVMNQGFSAGQGGWSVQIYDCISADIGFLAQASITFTDQGQCGTSVIQYNSGPINSTINDMSCDDGSASIYTVPLSLPYSYTIPNTIISTTWTSNGNTYNGPFTNITPPLDSTVYVMTVEDNFGCTKKDSVLYITAPFDATITTTIDTVCRTGDGSSFLLESVSPGGVWSGNGVVGNQFYPDNAAVIVGAPTAIIYTIGQPCPDADTIFVIVDEAPSILDFVHTCYDALGIYVIEFDISGGSAPFYVTDTNGIVVGNVDVLNHFTSQNITAGAPYKFIIHNGSSCGVELLDGVVPCLCNTYAGTINTNLITACENEPITAIHNNDSTLIANRNDVFGFFLHDGQGGWPFDTIAFSTNGTFYDNSFPGFQYGHIYYIVAAAAWDDGNGRPDRLDSCYHQTLGVEVLWNESPEAEAGPNDEICGNSIQLNASAISTGNGSWSCPTCVGQSFITLGGTSVSDTNATVSVQNYEVHKFRWTVTNGYCSDKDSVYITFWERPVANAGNDTVVCGNIDSLNAAFSIGSSGSWSSNDPSVSFVNGNFPNATVVVSVYKSYVFTWTEENGLCSDADFVKVTFQRQPNPDANHNEKVCENMITGHGIFNDYELNTLNSLVNDSSFNAYGSWSSNNGSVIYEDPTDANTWISIPTFTDVLVITFTWTEANIAGADTCIASDDVTITFFKIPIGLFDEATPPQSLTTCGNSYHFNGMIDPSSDSTIAYWTWENYPVTFDSLEDPKATATLNELVSFADTSVVNVPFTLILDNGGCVTTLSRTIKFYQEPKAVAGPDASVCEFDYRFNEFLYIPGGIGSWTPDLNFNPSNIDYTWYLANGMTFDDSVNVNTNDNSETLQFVWKEWNAQRPTCMDRDTVKITFYRRPDPAAGADQKVCGLIAQMHCIQSDTANTGFWSANGIQFTDQTDPQDSVTLMNDYGTVNFLWTEINGIPQCYDYGSTNVTFYENSAASHYVDDSVNCGATYVDLHAEMPEGNDVTGYWSDTVSSNSVFSPSPTSKDASVLVNEYGMHTFYWVVNNGEYANGDPVCSNKTEPIHIMFYEKPIANAGLDKTVCDTVAVLEAVPSGNGSFHGLWGGTNVVFSHNDTIGINTVPDASASVVSYGTYEYTWTENSAYPVWNCTNSDKVKITYAKNPSGNFFFYPPPCHGDTARVWADTTTASGVEGDNQAYFDWDFGDYLDSVAIGYAPAIGKGRYKIWWKEGQNATSTYLTEPAGRFPLDSVGHVIELIVTSKNNCMSPIRKDTIWEPLPMYPAIDIDSSTCGNANGSILLNETDTATGTLDFFTYFWESGMIADPDDLHPENLQGDTTYRLSITANSVMTYIPEYSNKKCVEHRDLLVENVGNVTAGIDTSQFTPGSAWYGYDSIADATIMFISRSSENASKFEWTLLDENNTEAYSANTQSPTITITEAGNYIIHLAVASKQGCTDAVEYRYLVITAESSLEVPNIFTPNGDNVNDYFKLGVKSLESMHIIIMNRWGKTMHEWSGSSNNEINNYEGWDGTTKAGRLAPSGVYFYVIEAVGLDGNEFAAKTFNGSLHLLRSK